jgi:AAA+ ATPase superfamily predicted ATPase
MDSEHDKIFQSLSDNKKTITQITGLSRVGKTTLLLHYADYYVSLGKQVLFISYGGDVVANKIEYLGLNRLKSTSMVISYNTDLNAVIEIFDKTNIDSNKFVVLIDGLDQLPKNKFVGAPLKEKQYLKELLDAFKKHASHVVFTNICYMTFTTYSPEDRGTLTTTVKIPVNYTILLKSKFEMTEELTAKLVKAKRLNKLAGLDLDLDSF